ncbi:MAG: glycosyl transferase family 1 [Candidatus Parabeggiatoa sp. nov. 1]|nr:MAG: glycosyl transferase family 1 [Gammaproteobacteria bacterium]
MSKILHLGKFFPPFAGGIENFLADLMPAQAEQGDTVAAIVHDHQPQLSRFLAPVQAEIWHNQAIYRTPSYGRLLYAPVSPQFPFWFNRVLDEFQPQLLHLHLPNTSAFFALWLSRARRIPWIIHWHADVVSALNSKVSIAYNAYRPFEQRLLAHAHTIVATSPPYLASSTALQPWQNKCQVIPLGIALARLPEPTPEAKHWAEQQWTRATDTIAKSDSIGKNRTTDTIAKSDSIGKKRTTDTIAKSDSIGKNRATDTIAKSDSIGKMTRILTIGRLTYYKGHEVLIRAIAQVDGAQVFIVGKGELRQRLETLITELNLAHKLKLLGYCSDAELTALFATCDCFCLPSLERTEAFGVVLLEAMRYAKPIIASAIPGSGVPWVIQDAGRLVPPQDTAALAQALQQMVDDPQMRTRLGECSRQRFEQLFDIKQVAEKMSALYRRVLQ